MLRVLKRFKPAVQAVAFSKFGAPVVEGVNRAASRWLDFGYNRDNDPVQNGEYWLVRRCRRDGLFLDVGFNCGDWSRYVLTAHERARVVAFDPDPGAQQAAVGLTGPRMSFVPCALGRSRGRQDFTSLGRGNPSNSLARRHHGAGEETRVDVFKVDVLPLDEWAAEASISDVALLKIDAEGFDFEVILGAERLFAAGAIDVCMFEYGYGWLEAGHLMVEASRFFQRFGYSVYRLFPTFLAPYAWVSTHENAVSGQFVALRSDLVSRFEVRPLHAGI